jgi:hypothetical protein
MQTTNKQSSSSSSSSSSSDTTVKTVDLSKIKSEPINVIKEDDDI